MNFSFFGYDFTLSEFIATACSLFLCVFYAVKTHGLKNIIKEVLNMKYEFKTANSVEPTVGQEFPTTKPVFRLNKANNELEDTGETVDLQEIINSCLETALDRALDKLLPKVEVAEDVVQLDLMREDLDYAMDVCDRAEEYRKKYNLSDKLSVNDIYAHVAKEAEILKAKIDTYQALKNQKESSENETQKIEPQGE